MTSDTSRREFLTLLGLGGVVFASGLGARAAAAAGRRLALPGDDDFFFVQLSDTHWGFSGPPNPEAANTLKQAVAAVNALPRQPDFIVFTGDLTHTTDDDAVRRQRMGEFKEIVKGLKTQNHRYLPGEHDASLDAGKAFQENFGATHYAFDHKGVHFVVLDNVSDPKGKLGDEQIDWLAKDIKPLAADAPLVVFTHRPLFDLAPAWDWATADGSKAIDVLQQRKHVTVFYGHIHQEHHQMTGRIAHHAAKSLMFPLPAPGSQPKRTPIAWDASTPYRGLGWRDVEADAARAYYELQERNVQGA